MKFLVLAYYDPEKFAAISKDELDAVVGGCAPHDAALRATGRVIMQASLEEPSVATSVRPRRGSMSATDGPFAETKEQVGAFFLIEAADRDDAVRVASLHPAANLGEQLGWGIEVRGIEQLVDS
jgi:hypothetical protein